MLRRAGIASRQHNPQATYISIRRYILSSISSSQSFAQAIHTSCPVQAAAAAAAVAVTQVRRVNQKLKAMNADIKAVNLLQDHLRLGKTDSLMRTISHPEPSSTGGGDQSSPPKYSPKLLRMIDGFFQLRSKHAVSLALEDIQSFTHHLTDREEARQFALDMVQSDAPQRALRVLAIAHKLGCHFKPNHYEIIAHEMAKEKQWALIPPLFSLGKRQCGCTSVRMLNWQTRAFIEISHFAQLERVLVEFEKQSINPTRRTYHLLVSGHLRNRNLSLAKQTLKRMVEAGYPIDASTHAIIVSAYSSLGPDAEVQARALETLHELDGAASTAVLNSILTQILDAQNPRGATCALKVLQHLSIPIKSFRKAGGIFTEVAGDETSAHVSHNDTRYHSTSHITYANSATFSILVDYMARQQDMQGVLIVLDHMAATGIKPDSGVIAALVRAYCVTGHYAAAINLVVEMCPMKHRLRLLLSLLGPSSQSTLPIDPAGIPLSAEIFNCLMRGIIKVCGMNGARIILQVMQENAVRADERTVEVVLAYLEENETSRPRQLIRLLRTLTLSSGCIQPSLRHIHIILRSVLRRQKFLLQGSGWNVFASKFSRVRRSHSRRQDPRCLLGTSDTFDPTAGICFPGIPRYRSLLRPIIQSLSERHIRGDRATFALRMRQDAVSKSDPESAKEVFRFMIARGMHPNEYHYAALMEGYAKQGDMESSKQIMRSAARAGIKPNVVMYTILIVGHARQGKPHLALRTFDAMLSASIQPDVASVDAVVSAFFFVGAYRSARKVLLALWTHIRPFPEELRSASLKQLSQAFRSHGSTQGTRKGLTKQHRRLLRWKLRRLVEIWDRPRAR